MKAKAVSSVVAGVVIGAVSSLWGYYTADAAVKVRPKLADVGVVDAFMAGHGFDWLFYHKPFVGAAATIAVWIIIIFVALVVYE